MFGLTQRRRQRLAKRPFPAEWAGVLDRNVHFYSRLQPADQSELQGHIQVFLTEKRFEGCAGLVISDEIRVTIAAHACMLLLHRQADYYPLLVTILVYTRLIQETEQGQGTFLDPYGGTNPAEFFAVATEFFFESPVRMRDQHPDLYAELKLYYQQDPAEAIAEGTTHGSA